MTEEETETVEYPKLKTAPFDARFPNQNQNKNCWQNYVDYFKCIRAKGEDFEPCQHFKSVYRSLCPTAWVSRWDEQRENNTFPALHEPRESHH